MDTVSLAEATKPTCGEGQRRVRTSAAAIGLAISVGAAGLALPKPSNASVVSESNSKAREIPDIAEDTPEARQNVETDTAADSLASALMVPSIDKTVVIDEDEAPAVEKAKSSERTLESSTPDTTATPEYINHIVREGQTLWQIASAYRVALQDITAENSISSDRELRVGETIRVPVRAGMNRNPQIEDIVADASEFSANRKALEKAIDVRGYSKRAAGERQEIAASDSEASAEESRVAYVSPLLESAGATQLNEFQQFRNGEDQLSALPQPELSLPIQVAFVREGSPNRQLVAAAPQPGANSSTAHRVVRGDTLFGIASRHGVSLEALIEANDLSNPNALAPGQELVLPLTPTPSDSDTPVVALLPETPVESESVAVPMTPFVAEPADRVAALSRREQAVASYSATPMSVVSEQPAPVSTEIALADTSDSESADLSIAYADSLRADIARARETEAASSAVPEFDSATEIAALPSEPASETLPAREMASIRVNPEFSARESVREAASAAVAKPATQPEVAIAVAPLVSPEPSSISESVSESVELEEDGELLAVAPIGARNYAPVLPPRSVSPDVPDLAAASEYLPAAGTPMGDMDGYVWPAQGVLTSGYGWRWGRMHNGIDIGAPTGTPIVAAAPGVVTYARWNSGGYGNLVEVTHPDGSLTLYAHNNRLLVSEGDVVEQGQHIADMGSTGFSTGPHLHFELHAAGQGAVNPIAYLQ